MNTTDRAVLQALLDATKRVSFVGDYKATDTEAFGMLMAQYFEWDSRILDAAAKALEDADFHAQSGEVAAMYQATLHVDDDYPIDDDMRKALLARMSEVYGKQIVTEAARSQRLGLLSVLADKEITSISRRYGNMTVGNFRRAMAVLDTFK